MTRPAFVLAALLAVSAFAAPVALAAPPVGTITQLSGLAMAVKADGRPRILSTASRVEAGDTVVSETGSYVRLVLDDGSEAVMGPSTTLKIDRHSATETALSLAAGLVQVTGVPAGPARRFYVEAGGGRIDAGSASFILALVPPPPGSAVALRRAYARSSLAALAPLVVSDAGSDLADLVAQNAPPPPRPPSQTPGLAPGLYVSVIDGAINMSNRGGSQIFTAGQFGYTANTLQPPVMVPTNPGLKFTPPPAFSSSNAPGSSTGNKAAAVDCEVR